MNLLKKILSFLYPGRRNPDSSPYRRVTRLSASEMNTQDQEKQADVRVALNELRTKRLEKKKKSSTADSTREFYSFGRSSSDWIPIHVAKEDDEGQDNDFVSREFASKSIFYEKQFNHR